MSSQLPLYFINQLYEQQAILQFQAALIEAQANMASFNPHHQQATVMVKAEQGAPAADATVPSNLSAVFSSVEPTPVSSPGMRSSSSPEDSCMRVKRGRPQQEIEDSDDPTSLKRRHRRLYARQYRAQMRQRVDEVKNLRQEVDEATRKIKEMEAELARTKSELAQKNLIITGLLQPRPAPY